ncbi:hypothetical protein LBA_00319 [Megavirus lba]|uniref:Uncharacterized protein n=1 Tax=Megavirus lba TaxID=1235314 RepID=L7Y3C6_9VIRU|nr:hypothetical protein LBA_00319 [Megavirus lba]
MNSQIYSMICSHPRLQRINDNFVRCQACGQSMISQKTLPTNKTIRDFTKENKYFTRNFDRNFSNVLDEVDEISSVPKYEYYTDKLMVNYIRINKAIQFMADPPKYQVDINAQINYLTQANIDKMLRDISAIRIDQSQYINIKSRCNPKM